MTIKERVSDLIKKFTQADMAALQRFVECCEDPDAGGHDVEKNIITRLSQYGALRQVRPGYHEVTEFGEFILNGGIDELQQYRADAEPVAWQWFHLNQWHVTNDEERARELAWDGVKVVPLYAAPQVTSVPDDFDVWAKAEGLIRESYGLRSVNSITDIARRAWSASRAASMAAPAVQAAPQTAAARDVLAERQRQVTAEGMTHLNDDAYYENQLSQAAGCYAMHAFNNGQRNFVPACWPWDESWWKLTTPRRNLVKAGALILAEIERLDRATGAPAVQAEQLSGNTEQVTKCWCHACRPVTMADMRFVVCPECGNKRCPHANDHRNACTGSNEPGQEGSAYPAAPQKEAE